jgi:hypothetical protein
VRYSLSVLLCGVWLLALTSETLQEAPFTGMKVAVVSGMAQIRLGDWQLGLWNEDKPFYAAKNEFEGFQLVLRAPRGGLTGVKVTVEPFRNDAGETLPVPTLYREHYVYAHAVQRDYFSRDTFIASNVPQGAGWYADALIPFAVNSTQANAGEVRFWAQPFEVAAFQNQPIWVDIYVPADARAGSYRSRYTVTSDQGDVTGEIVTGELRLEVWNFTLPQSPSLDSSFLVWKQNNKATYIELLKHKLMPDYVEPEYQAELINDWGLRLQRLGFVAGASIDDCTMNPPPSVAELQKSATEQDERLSLYMYPADEITACNNLNETMKAWSRNAHEAGVKNLVTMFPRPELFNDGTGTSAVDIWVIYATQLMAKGSLEAGDNLLETLQDVLEKGNEVWSYTALAAEPHAPQWALNYSAFDFRLLAGFINLRYGMTGLLYWRVDNWSDDPWQTLRVDDDPSNYPAGEGMLLYPGEAVGVDGVVPSLRLKWLREGAEDYEYGQLLTKMGEQDVLDRTVRGVAKDWYHWTKQAGVLESARQKLAAAILMTTGLEQK